MSAPQQPQPNEQPNQYGPIPGPRGPQQPNQYGPHGPQQPNQYGPIPGTQSPQQPYHGPAQAHQGQPPQAFHGQPPQQFQQPPGGAPVASKRAWYKKKRFVIPGALLALILLVNVGNGGNKSATVAGAPATSLTSASSNPSASADDGPTEAASEEATDEPTEEPSDEATDEPTEDPSDEATDEPEPEVSKAEKALNKLSDEQQDAVGEGEDYLESQGFSKAGLIHQLSSDYGSQYKKKDAVKAVDYLEDYEGVDWKKQAVRVAKDYRETMHFSTDGLIHQLESDYGSQFTHDQAVYGAKHSR